MFPGVNLCNSMLIVYHNHFLSAFKALPVGTARGDTLTHAAGRDVDDFAQAVLWDSNADRSQQPCAIRYILHRVCFAVAEYAAEHEQEQRGNDDAADG